MDSCDSDKQKNKEGEKSEDGEPLHNFWHVLQPFWIRLAIQNGIRPDRIILDYHRYFLPCCGIVLWSVFLLLKS